jgi:hypothetical protein
MGNGALAIGPKLPRPSSTLPTQTSNFQGASAGPARLGLPPDGAATVCQFWPVWAGGNGGWGRAKPIVPGGASKLTLRVSTLCNVVINAAIAAITKAVAKIANAVRWVFIIDPLHLPIMQIGRLRFLPCGGIFRGRIIDLSRAATRADTLCVKDRDDPLTENDREEDHQDRANWCP